MNFLSKQKQEDFGGKTVLLRTDYNIEADEDSIRINASLPAIAWLLMANAKIVILTHKGRPNLNSINEEIDKLGLKSIIPLLENKINQKIRFISLNEFDQAKEIISNENYKVFLLENLRFFKGEDENDEIFGKKLADLGDIFVNGAFSVCHRENASICQIPKFIKSYAGFQLEKEILSLNQAMEDPQKPFTLILGGAKASDKIPIIKNLINKIDICLLGGVPANTFLKTNNIDIKKSVYEESMLEEARNLFKTGKIILPEDFIWKDDKMYDVGEKTIKTFDKIIKNSKTIIWNGPLGYFEEEKYMFASQKIAESIANTDCFSLIGGGETGKMIQKTGIIGRFSFISTGGGAMLEYLSGKKLPGIEVLL